MIGFFKPDQACGLVVRVTGACAGDTRAGWYFGTISRFSTHGSVKAGKLSMRSVSSVGVRLGCQLLSLSRTVREG